MNTAIIESMQRDINELTGFVEALAIEVLKLRCAYDQLGGHIEAAAEQFGARLDRSCTYAQMVQYERSKDKYAPVEQLAPLRRRVLELIKGPEPKGLAV